MADVKIQNIQDKLHEEKLRVQAKFQKEEVLQKSNEIIQKTEKEKVKKVEKSKDIADEYKNYKRPEYYSSKHQDYSSGSPAGAILGGIMIMIIGFAILTIGQYVLTALSQSISVVNSNGINSSYGTTPNDVMNYVSTVAPLMGLAVMALGFVGVLFSLRSGMDNNW